LPSELLRTLTAASGAEAAVLGVRALIQNGAPRRINVTNMCRSLYYPENACGHRRAPLIAASGRERYCLRQKLATNRTSASEMPRDGSGACARVTLAGFTMPVR
jgi:hypothetical protein